MTTQQDLQNIQAEISSRFNNFRSLEAIFQDYCKTISATEWNWCTPTSEVAGRSHQRNFSAFGYNFLLNFSHNTEQGIITYAIENMDERGAWKWQETGKFAFDKLGNSTVANMSVNLSNQIDCQFIHQLAVLLAVRPKSS